MKEENETQTQLSHDELKAALKKRGIRSIKVAKRLNRSVATISQALNGAPGFEPTLRRIQKYYFRDFPDSKNTAA